MEHQSSTLKAEFWISYFLANSEYLLSIFYLLGSGSKWWTQVSSPVIILSEKRLCFIFVSVIQVSAGIHAIALMHISKLSWHASCTDFSVAKFLMDVFVCRTMTNLQKTCHLIDGHMSVRQKHLSSLLNLHASDGGWCRSLALSLCITIIRPF